MDQIICHIEKPELMKALEFQPDNVGSDELRKLGFTNIITPDSDTSHLNLDVQSRELLDLAQDLDVLLSNEILSSEQLWNDLMLADAKPRHLRLHGILPELELAALLIQLSLPHVPIIDCNERMVPGTALHASRAGREYRELLRSLTFWRTRFQIGRQRPRLVHADDGGLLIYIIDSWLIAVNLNGDEASIDVGTGGAMWLMLATGHDVHLHGSLLDLPPNSGAILANELAR